MSSSELSLEEEKECFKLLNTWTFGMSPVDQRISVFSHVRDIPYAIIPEWRNKDTVHQMLLHNMGWCGPKHVLLLWMFEKLGITAEPLLIPFRWGDQEIRYPVELIGIVSSLGDTVHMCCRVLLSGQWQIVDATWDLPLKGAGFPVNESWDGESGTRPAVIRLDENSRHTICQDYLLQKKNRGDFVYLLNHWLEKLRKT